MTTFLFFFGLAASAVCLTTPFVIREKLFRLAWVAVPLGLLLSFAQTAMYVENDSRGIMYKKFGGPLTSGHVVAFNGERGPQAQTLSPGWNFWLWPWQYSLKENKNMQVPAGQIATFVALDGQSLGSLPDDPAYAPKWESVEEMLDGVKFGKSGYAGPQLTVAPAGKTVAFNPELFKVELDQALIVPSNECVVIKSNVGKKFAENQSLVPVDHIGIWDTPYFPGTYYLHPKAYEPIHVISTKRVYSYTGTSSLGQRDRPDHDHSIGVKTMEGYKFPVHVRVEIIVEAENAPYLVSRIGPPDTDSNQDGFDNLEETVIIPAIQSIFRNTAEHTSALEYLNSRSTVEKEATAAFTEAMNEYRVTVISVSVADIGLDETEEGKKLLLTQTDKELARQEILTFAEQQRAAEAEKDKIAAEAEAEAQSDLKKSEVNMQTQENEGLAESNKATGEAEAVTKKIQAYGGYSQYLLAEAIKAFGNNWSGDLPEIVVTGEGSGLDQATMATILQQVRNSEDATEK